MPEKELKMIGVIGLGAMGSGIAQVTAQAGYQVKALDQNQTFLDRGMDFITKSLGRSVKKGALTESQKTEIVSRIQCSENISTLTHCDLIIEAIFDDFDIKKKLFHDLDELCPAKTIFASNTSSLSVTRLASGLSHADRMVGTHFFNPAQVMKLVEVIKTVATSDDVIETLFGFVRSLGKEPVMVRDQAGFLVNYLLAPYLFDAIRALSAGLNTVEGIDNAMRYGCGYPMGPLALCDRIGLDVLVAGGNQLFEEYHDAKFAPPPLMKRLVEIGDLGFKTKRGFYDYQDPKNPQPRRF